MEWHNIQNWQNNIAEDVKNKKLAFDENLINAILEVASQLAKFREDLRNRIFDFPKFPETIPIPLPTPVPLPDKYFNSKGEVDLSKVTGEDARKYFVKFLGIELPIGVSRVKG